jgi:tetratricopeptide (TPR) repeat protein
VDDRKIQLWHKATAISRERLGDVARAESLLRGVLDVDAEDQAALRGLDEIYVAAGRSDDLEQILRRRVATADYDDDKVRLLGRLAELYLSAQGDADKAGDAYRSILELDETNEPALRKLADIYELQDDWQALSDVRRRLAALVESDTERLSLYESLAQVAEVRLGKADDAIELWEEVLLLEPGRRSALAELQRLLEAAGRSEDLAEAFERELALTEPHEVERKVYLHRRLGRLGREVLEDGLSAQHHWEQVLALDSDDLEALTNLRELYRDNGAMEPLAGVLESLVLSGAYEGEAQRDLWIELAELHQDVMGQPLRAIDAWEAVWSLDDKHEDALDNLERLYTNQNRWADAASVLTRRAGLLQSQGKDDDAIELMMRVGEIHLGQLQDPGEAARTYESVLAKRPDHIDASTPSSRSCCSGAPSTSRTRSIACSRCTSWRASTRSG